MKRSDFFIKLTTAVLFLAVASYIGVSIYSSLMRIYVTTPALSYSIEETFDAQGYIIRTETVVRDIGDAIVPTVKEGEKVASGQAIAVEYMNREALETASEIRELRMKVAKLESPGEVAAGIRRESVLSLSQAVHSGNLEQLSDLYMSIETYIFSDISSSVSELPALAARLEYLESRNTGVRTVFAPVSGTFSQVVDGFEQITPGQLSDLTPARLEALFRAPSGVSGACKLVTEFRWYFAAVMSAEDALRLPVGRQIIVQFSGPYNAAARMLVESVGRRDNGVCVVLFSSDRGIHDVVSLRETRADVLHGTISGIRVPKEAIQLDDDGTTFIYLQTGVRAERVDVEILLEFGDSYLVRDGADTGSPLRAGSTIIVKANNLYHGKIVA